MQIKIRKYKDSDFNLIKECIESLVDHVIKTDHLKRSRRLPVYSNLYTKKLFLKVKNNNGTILIAYKDKNVAGFIAGYIEKQTKEDLLECIQTKIGKIEDLYIYPEYRSKNIGKLLMSKIEKFFKKQKADILKLHVFYPNKGAYKFYKRLNFHERNIEMIKLIK